MFLTAENKTLNLVCFYTTTFLFAPWMLLFNMYGNVLYQQIKGDCEADWAFKAYMVILLIAVYCGVFLYAIFAASLRECLKRYYILMYNLNE